MKFWDASAAVNLLFLAWRESQPRGREPRLPGRSRFLEAGESCAAFEWFYSMRRVSGVEPASEAILRISFSSLSSPHAETLHGAGFFVAPNPGSHQVENPPGE